MKILSHYLEIIKLAWHWAGRYYFDLAVIINEDIVRMYVSNFFFDSWEFMSSSNHVIEQVPNLCFFKIFIDLISIFDFSFQYVREVFINNLFIIINFLLELYHSNYTSQPLKTHTLLAIIRFILITYHQFSSFMISNSIPLFNFILIYLFPSLRSFIMFIDLPPKQSW